MAGSGRHSGGLARPLELWPTLEHRHAICFCTLVAGGVLIPRIENLIAREHSVTRRRAR